MRAPKQITIVNQEIDLEKAIADALEKILAPVAEVICEMERIRRKEYLTEKEAALLFSLSAATLKTQRSRGGGPPYIKIGSHVLYSRKSLIEFLSKYGISEGSVSQHVDVVFCGY
jgi:hypothetical protein